VREIKEIKLPLETKSERNKQEFKKFGNMTIIPIYLNKNIIFNKIYYEIKIL
jgi:hypothetical protein